jgi:hypothetical protein
MKNTPYTVFVADGDTQVPQVSLSMPCAEYTRLTESICLLILHGNDAANGVLRWALRDTRTSHEQIVADMLPVLVHNGKRLPTRDLSEQTTLARMMWNVDYLVAYANYRNALEHQYLVGDHDYTRAMVYAALLAMHEQRVCDIKDSIEKDGPSFGSATGYWTINWMECVADWPEKHNFERN